MNLFSILHELFRTSPLKALFTPLPQYADIPACLQSREALTLTDQMTRALLGAAKRSTTIVSPALRIKAFLSRKAQITAALN